MMILTPLRSVSYAAAAAILLGATSDAQAGPLLDWILGRNTTVAPGYVAGYPVYPSNPAYAAGYAPYTAGYAPAAYAAGYAPATGIAPVTTYRPVTTPVGSVYNPYRSTTAYSPVTTGSVVSGVAPTTSDVASVAPVTAYSPGTVAGSPYYGTGNLYPSAASYAAYSVNAAAPVGVGAAPVVPAYRPGPIRRLLARLFGHGYQTSYYRAPVTYYRPVTTGTTTALSPCTSYQYQIQRTPTHSLLPTATYPAPTNPTVPCPDQCGQGGAAPMGTVPSYPNSVPSQTPSGTVIPGAPTNPGIQYPAPGASGGDTVPMQAPALAPGEYVPGTASTERNVRSSYSRPVRQRAPNPKVKPIPARAPENGEAILPGDRTAQAERQEDVVPASWVRVTEPAATRSVARPSTPRPVSAAPTPRVEKKVYQDVNWQ